MTAEKGDWIQTEVGLWIPKEMKKEVRVKGFIGGNNGNQDSSRLSSLS